MAAAAAEEARALLVDLCPGGFEERDGGPGCLELVAYVPAGEEARLLARCDGAAAEPVESGWSTAWQEYFRPVRIGSLWVGPPWQEPDPDAIAVVVEPGMAFGTGTHPTTRLCLELLVERPPGSVLDVGCGSGVLAIAAACLGCAPVLAVDLDEASVSATRENAARNRVRVEARVADAREAALPACDLVTANLELRLLEQVVPRLEARAAIVSGLLAAEKPAIPGWRRLLRRERDGWAAELVVPDRLATIRS